jgi:hypothetical protein
MTKSQSRRARELRQLVIAWLGGKCARCDGTDDLEVDHPGGISWNRRRKDALGRARVYAWEADHGLVRVLCKECNSEDTQDEMPERDLFTMMSDEPF